MDREDRPIVRYVGGEPPAEDGFRRALERSNVVTVEAAREYEAALDALDAVDCVVCVHDQRIDGLELLEGVHARHRSLPFVLVASSADGSAVSRAVAAGISGFVPRDHDDAAGMLVDRVETLTARETPLDIGKSERMPIDDFDVREELRLKERAMDAAPVGIAISDPGRPDNPLIYCNDAFETVTGYPPAETIGRNCRFLQNENADPDAVAAMREAIDREEPVSVELRNERKSGEEFWNKVDIAPVSDGETVTHFVGFQRDVTDRKDAELDLARERENLQTLLERIEGLVNDVTEILVESSSRAAIERGVCDRIGAVDAYEFVWIAGPDLANDVLAANATAGDWNPATTALEVPLDGAESDAHAAVARAYRTGRTQRVSDVSALSAIADARPRVETEELGGMVAIPLSYHETCYGVIVVYAADADALADRDTVVLEALARATATALNALERGRALAADSVVEVEVEFRDADHVLVDLSARTEGTVESNGVAYRDDGATLLFVTASGPVSTVESVVERHPEIDGVSLINEHDEGNLFEFTLSEPSLVNGLADRGATIRTMTAADGVANLSVELSNESDARAIVELVRQRYPDAELVRHRHHERPPETKQEFLAGLEGELTDRQRTALQKAYVSGFYERTRPVSGDELAASMGLSRPTFHQHRRAAERKLLEEFFER